MLKMFFKLKILFFLFIFQYSIVNAQESINASGGDALGSGGSTAYSIGQVVYTINTSSSGTSEQGVQHAYEIYSVGIKETEVNIFLSVFPNPTFEKNLLTNSRVVFGNRSLFPSPTKNELPGCNTQQ
jgi:hypothetical protein